MTGHDSVRTGVVCPSCSGLNDSQAKDVKFCEHCGAPIPERHRTAHLADPGGWDHQSEGIELRPAGARLPPRRQSTGRSNNAWLILAVLLLAAGLACLLGTMFLTGRL
jgi:hypothetical protein